MVRWLLYLGIAVLSFVVLRKLAPILMPVVAAGGVAYLLDGWADTLVEKGLSRVMAVTLLLVIFLSVTGTILVLAIPLISAELVQFVVSLPLRLEELSGWLRDNVGVEIPSTWREYVEDGQLEGLMREAAGPAASVTAAAVGGLFSIVGILAELLLIPVFAFYFLVDWDHLLERGRALVPPRHRDFVTGIVVEIDGAVSTWIRGQLMVTSTLAVLYAIAFKVIGIELGITIGAIVGLLTVIPFLGTLVGAIMTGGILFMDYPGLAAVIAVALVFVVLHLLEAAVLTPKLVGKKVGLGEVGALFAVLAGGQLLGFTGVLLAVPIAASLAVLIRRAVGYYEASEFFQEAGELIADLSLAPAPSPAPGEETDPDSHGE